MPIVVDVIVVVLAHAIGAWLITYLLHSTVLLVIARGLEGVLDEPALLAVVWRTAIFGPLITASVHTVLPFGNPLRVSVEAAGAVLGPRPVLALVVVVCWCMLVTLRASGSMRTELRGRAQLRPRHAATDPALLDMLATRSRSAGLARTPRLTTSPRICSPATLVTGEICLPENIFDQLSRAEQNALLAHEIAHHARRDPLWCGAATAVAAICFFQPLNRLAVRQLRRASEHAADAHAVRDTRDPLALARALAALAPHVLRGARLRTAATGSPLLQRIRRILDRPPSALPRHSHALVTACVAVLLGLCLALGPGVNFSPDDAANSIPSLTPSPREPTPQMIELRRFDRKLRHFERTVARRAAATILP